MTDSSGQSPESVSNDAQAPVGTVQGAPAPKKSNAWVWVLGVVLLVVVGSGVWLWSSKAAASQRERDIKASYAVVGEDVDSAGASLKSATARLMDLQSADKLSRAQLIITAARTNEVDLKTATNLLNDAETRLATMADSTAKGEFVSAIAGYRQSMKDMAHASQAIKELAGTCDTLESVMKRVDSSNRVMDVAVNAGNHRKWAEAISRASKAKAGYSKAVVSLSKLQKRIDDPQSKVLLHILRLRVQLADDAVRVSVAGRNRSVSGYQAAVDRYNATTAAINKMKAPAAATDPWTVEQDAWVTVTKLSLSLDEGNSHASKAARALAAGAL